MLLEDKNAVIYGGGGGIGVGVARPFARERAKVFLAGRNLVTLDEVAQDISAAGGVVEKARVDALDEQAVEKHGDAVAEKAGSADITFDATGMGDVQGTPLAEMSLQDFAFLVMIWTRTQFLTWISDLQLDTIDVGGHREETAGRR